MLQVIVSIYKSIFVNTDEQPVLARYQSRATATDTEEWCHVCDRAHEPPIHYS